MQWERGGYEISDDAGRPDAKAVHAFLAGQSYWAENIPRSITERAISNSLCFGLYHEGRLAGFARVVTDRATFGYLCDVFVAQEHRGEGRGRWLVACVLQHPDLQGLRRLCLMTRDAHGLYEPFGFREMKDPSRYLEIHRPDVYKPA